MITILFKWVIFISSYVPIFVMIFLNNLSNFTFYSLKKTWQINTLFWWILIIISIVSVIILFCWLYLLKKESKSDKAAIQIHEFRSYDSEVLNYFVTFIIPILSLNPSSWPSIVMNLFLLIVEGMYFVSNNALYYNILLIICRYHLYTIAGDNIVITKKKKSELLFDIPKAKQVGTTNIYYI